MYRYKSVARNLTLFINTESGATVEVKFDNGSGNDKNGSYFTMNKQVAAAIEKSPLFGRFITRVGANPSDETKKGVQETKTYDAVYPEVKSTQKAIKVIESLGHDASGVKSAADAIAMAESLNIQFPNLKR